MSLLIGSKQRLAAIVALQANVDSQRLNAVLTAHFHQHQRALALCVRIDRKAPVYGKKGEEYLVVDGY